MTVHVETFVKVNARADEGIAPLVAALSEFEQLETVESCQGGNGHPAFVILRHGDWRACGAFLFDRLLAAMNADLRADVSVELIAYDTTNCLGRISLSPEAIVPLAELVTSVRKSAYSGGTTRTSRDSC